MKDDWNKILEEKPKKKTYWIDSGVSGYEYYPMPEFDVWLEKVENFVSKNIVSIRSDIKRTEE